MAKNEKDVNKNKGHYFKDMKAELKKVIWPSKKQTANNTVAVIAFALVLALVVFVLDVCFDLINKKGVVALQQKITSSYNTNTTSEESQAENNEENASEENTTAEEGANTESAETSTENDSNESNTEIQE